MLSWHGGWFFSYLMVLYQPQSLSNRDWEEMIKYNEVQRPGEEMVVAYFKVQSCDCLKGLRKTTKQLG